MNLISKRIVEPTQDFSFTTAYFAIDSAVTNLLWMPIDNIWDNIPTNLDGFQLGRRLSPWLPYEVAKMEAEI